jgi:hypothetical protein
MILGVFDLIYENDSVSHPLANTHTHTHTHAYTQTEEEDE